MEEKRSSAKESRDPFSLREIGSTLKTVYLHLILSHRDTYPHMHINVSTQTHVQLNYA